MHETEPTRTSDEQVSERNEQRDTRPNEGPPRVYIASLSDYNAGRLYGKWIDAAVNEDDLHGAVESMLAVSPTPGAEEFAIHDYEGFGPLRLGEYESLETVSRVARGISEHGPTYAHWAALTGASDAETLERFEDAYRGHWDSVEAYAESLLDDLGANSFIDEAVPEYLQPYVKLDIAGFARDLEYGGDITISEGDGGTYVFGSNW